MPGRRIVQLYTATMASVRWQASHDQTSCRGRAPVTSSMATWPTKTPSARCPRLCWGLRSARWRLSTTVRMVSQWPGNRCGCQRTPESHAGSYVTWCSLRGHPPHSWPRPVSLMWPVIQTQDAPWPQRAKNKKLYYKFVATISPCIYHKTNQNTWQT